jgi:hypothetical protein
VTPVRVGRRSKFNNVITKRDGYTFDSLREADRYRELMLLQLAGEIRNLTIKRLWPLVVKDVPICIYEEDFSYRERTEVSKDWPTADWPLVVEDVKGHLTREYKIKRALMKACHGITIRETK